MGHRLLPRPRHVYGPTGELKPLLHYAVLVRRLDVLRAVMHALDAWGDMDARTHIMNMEVIDETYCISSVPRMIPRG